MVIVIRSDMVKVPGVAPSVGSQRGSWLSQLSGSACTMPTRTSARGGPACGIGRLRLRLDARRNLNDPNPAGVRRLPATAEVRARRGPDRYDADHPSNAAKLEGRRRTRRVPANDRLCTLIPTTRSPRRSKVLAALGVSLAGGCNQSADFCQKSA